MAFGRFEDLPTVSQSAGSSDGPATDVLAARVGATVRRRRRALGLTMQEMARRAGISQPFLSQIERGLARPSMRSLDQIAQSLGSSAISLLAGDDRRADVEIVRAAEQVSMVQTELAAGSTAVELTRGARHLHAVEFGGGSADFQDRYFVHRNEELAVILEGRYVFDVAGAHHELGPGDTIAYSGGIPHRYRLVGDPPHRFLAVIVHDDFDVVRHHGQGSPGATSETGETVPLVTAGCAVPGA
jgi:transcriptional regulator with XRE-family HTH domain